MKAMKNIVDEDLNIIEFIEILWHGKFTIILVSLAMALAGFVYGHITSENDKTRYQYNISYHSPLSDYEQDFKRKAESKFANTIKFKSHLIEINVTEKKNAEYYLQLLENMNTSLSNEALIDARYDIEFVESLLNHTALIQLPSEIVNRLYAARKLVLYVEQGKDLISFFDASFTEIQTKNNTIYFKTLLFGIIGLFISVSILLLRRGFQKRSEERKHREFS